MAWHYFRCHVWIESGSFLNGVVREAYEVGFNLKLHFTIFNNKLVLIKPRMYVSVTQSLCIFFHERLPPVEWGWTRAIQHDCRHCEYHRFNMFHHTHYMEIFIEMASISASWQRSKSDQLENFIAGQTANSSLFGFNSESLITIRIRCPPNTCWDVPVRITNFFRPLPWLDLFIRAVPYIG